MSEQHTTPPRTVTCPRCRKNKSLADRAVWPFCSERCKNSDFIDWTQESYSIPCEEPDSELDAEEAIFSTINDE